MKFSSGDLILKEESWVHALVPDCISTHCDGCLIKSSYLWKCTGCHVFNYCSRECQKAQWPMHKLECKCMVADDDIPVDFVRLILRVLIYRKKTGYDAMANLVSHADEIRNDRAAVRLFRINMIRLDHFVNGQINFHEDEVYEVFCKIKINAFSITNSDYESIATAIFPKAAKIDHSCVPNASYTFYGRSIFLVATKEIQEGMEVRINYIGLLSTKDERQAICMSNYYFRCNCSRCLDTDEDLLLTSIYCCTVIPFSLNKNQPRSHECPTCHRKYSTSVLGRIYHQLHTVRDEERQPFKILAELLSIYIQVRGCDLPTEYTKLCKLFEQNVIEDEDSNYETVKQHYKVIGKNNRNLYFARIFSQLAGMTDMELINKMFLHAGIIGREQGVIHAILVACSMEVIKRYEDNSDSWSVGYCAKHSAKHFVALLARSDDPDGRETMCLANKFVPTPSSATSLSELLIHYLNLAKTHLEPQLRINPELKTELAALL